MTTEKYSEWRVLTPLLLAVIVIGGAIIGYLITDKLNSINDKFNDLSDKGNKLFTLVGEMKTSFDDYKISSEGRFAKLEQKLIDNGSQATAKIDP